MSTGDVCYTSSVASNGYLTAAELAPIRPYGELANNAAASWNYKNGPADNNLRPTGPELSTYRSFAGQLKTWAAYLAGGALAARPGYSNHGWGLCVDLAEEWMRSWIDDHGASFGWKKTEAFSEWWHVNFVGGSQWVKAQFNVLRKGDKGKRVKWYTKRLAYIHASGHGAYLKRKFGTYKQEVADAVHKFQRDQDMVADGVIGEKTAHRISEVFHKQYIARNKRKRVIRKGKGLKTRLAVQTGGRKRRKRDVALLRP